jgi:hypothetical protein
MNTPPSPGDSIARNTVAERISILMFESEREFGQNLMNKMGPESVSVVYAKEAQDALNLLSSITLDALMIPATIQRNKEILLWEEMAAILPKTTALYTIAKQNDPKPTGPLTNKVRAILEPPCSSDIVSADLAAFLEERRSSPEKRRWDRIPVLMDVSLAFENNERLDAVALNIGLGGFFVALPSKFKLPPMGSRVAFDFKVPDVQQLKGMAVVQWSQEAPLGRSSPQARGLGCEFFQPAPEFIETMCRMINALVAHHVPKEIRSRMKAKDLAAKAVRLLGWLGSHKVTLKEGALTSERECVCFEPLLTLNLTGFLLGFCETQGKIADEIFLDFCGNENAAEFKVEIKGQPITPDTIATLKAYMPAIFAAAGGRESLHIHHVNLDFAFSGDSLAIAFRFPTRGP